MRAARPAELSFLPAGESDLRLKAEGIMLPFAARKLLLTVFIMTDVYVIANTSFLAM